VSGQGETAVIIASGVHGGERAWTPFVAAIDKDKFTAITYSYIQEEPAVAIEETAVILEFLRQAGYQRIICVGHSLGVTACGSITAQPELIGVVMVSGPEDAQGVRGGDCQCASLETLTYPKLYIATEKDPFAPDVQKLYEQASEPKTLVLFPASSVRGGHLFDSPVGKPYLELLIDFINSV
jgi:hypothetical protein